MKLLSLPVGHSAPIDFCRLIHMARQFHEALHTSGSELEQIVERLLYQRDPITGESRLVKLLGKERAQEAVDLANAARVAHAMISEEFVGQGLELLAKEFLLPPTLGSGGSPQDSAHLDLPNLADLKEALDAAEAKLTQSGSGILPESIPGVSPGTSTEASEAPESAPKAKPKRK